MLDTLHSERFQDQSPRQIYAELLDEGKYVGSPSTMYRILAAHGGCSECRNQRGARSHAVPRLEATAPNQVWTWDISKLATYASGVFLNLYLVLDLYSRFPIAWMIAERENSALSKQLFAEAITRYRLEPGSITVHNDRGAPMTSSAFIDLLAQLGVDRSVSRTRVSNESAVSRRLVNMTRQQPDAWLTRRIAAVMVDGIEVAEHTIVVALGITETGEKQPLGLLDGATENSAVCRALLDNLVQRGLEPQRLLVRDRRQQGTAQSHS